jgi:hypothetical protein
VGCDACRIQEGPAVAEVVAVQTAFKMVLKVEWDAVMRVVEAASIVLANAEIQPDSKREYIYGVPLDDIDVLRKALAALYAQTKEDANG